MNFFDDAYAGVPPWDIGKPQRAFVDLYEAGAVTEGPVLEVGCGTGEHALFFAAKGFEAMGIDTSELALAKARGKAAERGLAVEFRRHDALDLASLGRTFPTIVDNGLFHVFGNRERRRFANGLAATLRPGGTYFMMCFSEKEPADWGGPRRVSKAEIRETFAKPRFRVRSIRASHFETNFHEDGGKAYLAVIDRS